MAVPLCIPTNSESSRCSTSLSAFGMVCVLDFSQSNRYAVVVIVSICNSPMTYYIGHLSTCMFFHLCIFCGVDLLLHLCTITQIYCPFLKIGLFVFHCFKCPLHILDTSPLSDRCVFCKYFLPVCKL